MATENLERAFASTRNVLSNVRSDQLDDPTPCISWDVRTLINHIVGGSHWFAASTNAGVAPDVPDTDFASGDFVASYDEGVKASLAAFGAPGAQEKIVKLPFGEFPGSAWMGLATMDTFQHGWDLAKATGQDTDLDPDLAAGLLANAGIPDQFRGPDGQAPFGQQVDADDSAPPASQLAAYLGRAT